MTIVKDDLTPCTDRNDSILQQDRLFIGIYPTGIAYADKQSKSLATINAWLFCASQRSNWSLRTFARQNLSLASDPMPP